MQFSPSCETKISAVPGRGVLGREEGLGVDAVGGELLPEGCGAGVVAQTRDEGHVAAQARGRDGLVGPFAAVGLHEARLRRRSRPGGADV